METQQRSDSAPSGLLPVSGVARDAGDSSRPEQWSAAIRAVFWLAAISLGGLQALASWFPVGEDGVSYLDIADAYLKHDWHNAINAYWPPLNSWLFAAGLSLVRPSPFWESSVVHSISLLVYLGAIVAFEFCLRQILVLHRAQDAALAADGTMRLPDNALVALAYGVFIYVSFEWITVPLETPDMLLSIFIYLATGLVLRMRSEVPSIRTFFLLGVVLGVGYLAKTAMLPLSVVYIGLAFSAIARQQRRLKRVAAAVVGLMLLAGPFIAVISIHQGHLTIGETGKLDYIWFANGGLTERYRFWYRLFPDDTLPVHPSRKVLAHPATYEFGSDPVGGSYPPWFDPSYWHQGVKARFDVRGQLRVLRWSAGVWWRLLVTDTIFFLFGAFILLVVGFRDRSVLLRDVVSRGDLFVLFLAGMGIYSLVLLSPRYVAAFVGLFWIGLFSIVRLPRSTAMRRLSWAVAVSVLLMMGLRVANESYELARSARDTILTPVQSHLYWRIAQGLEQLGVHRGDKVAGIGYGAAAYWARLAGVRVVGETFSEDLSFEVVPEVDRMLEPDGSMRPEVLEIFHNMGAKVLIARRLPVRVAQHGWVELGEGTWRFGHTLPK